MPAVSPNRAVADDDAQLEQFGTPQPVRARHGHDQVLDFGTEVRAATSRAGCPAPEEAPTLLMPTHDRFGRDDCQVLAPASTEAARQDPQQLVRRAKPRTRSGSSGAGQDGE